MVFRARSRFTFFFSVSWTSSSVSLCFPVAPGAPDEALLTSDPSTKQVLSVTYAEWTEASAPRQGSQTSATSAWGYIGDSQPSEFVSQGTLGHLSGDIFGCPDQRGSGRCYWLPMGRGQECHHASYFAQDGPPRQNYLAPNSAEVGKTWATTAYLFSFFLNYISLYNHSLSKLKQNQTYMTTINKPRVSIPINRN